MNKPLLSVYTSANRVVIRRYDGLVYRLTSDEAGALAHQLLDAVDELELAEAVSGS